MTWLLKWRRWFIVAAALAALVAGAYFAGKRVGYSERAVEEAHETARVESGRVVSLQEALTQAKARERVLARRIDELKNIEDDSGCWHTPIPDDAERLLREELAPERSADRRLRTPWSRAAVRAAYARAAQRARLALRCSGA